jgi:hypothetical protein
MPPESNQIISRSRSVDRARRPVVPFYETTRRAYCLRVEASGTANESARSGIGAAMNSRRAILASHRARRADFVTRALSVAMPVFAYICRYNFEMMRNAIRERSERTHLARCQIADTV